MTCRHDHDNGACDVCSTADRPALFGIDLAPATRTGTCYGPCGDPVLVGEMVLAGDGETPLIHAGCYARMHDPDEVQRREDEKQAEARLDAAAWLGGWA